MKFLKYILLTCLFLLIKLNTFAQDYDGAIGLRFGYGIGLTAKVVLRNDAQIEILARYGYHGVSLNKRGICFTGMYEKYKSISRNQNWYFYGGGGASIGYGANKVFAYGICPIIGTEVNIRNFPIQISMDYKPTLFLERIGNKLVKTEDKITYFELGLSVRYCIGR